MSDPDLKHVFVDNQYEHGQVFCKHFLASREFSDALLSGLVPRGAKSQPHAQKAARVAELIFEKKLDADRVVLEFCRLPRDWLTYWHVTTSLADLPAASTSLQFLSTPGDKSGDWFGPIRDPDGTRAWYVWTMYAKHHAFDESTPPEVRVYNVRWNLIAEIRPGAVAFHWNNFTLTGGSLKNRDSQFPFWEHIPKAKDSLVEGLGGEWRKPNLFRSTFNMFELFDTMVGPVWTHLRVRAERDGLSFSAKTAGVREINVEGLASLTRNLALKALTTNSVPLEPLVLKATSRALLMVLLKDWGTRSYEYQLSATDAGLRFHGHIYFGMETDPKFGQDTLQHVLCMRNADKSARALEFLLRTTLEDEAANP